VAIGYVWYAFDGGLARLSPLVIALCCFLVESYSAVAALCGMNSKTGAKRPSAQRAAGNWPNLKCRNRLNKCHHRIFKSFRGRRNARQTSCIFGPAAHRLGNLRCTLCDPAYAFHGDKGEWLTK